ncbi:hypothetical protein Dimus_009490 [Dionaea muscipula]
MLGDFGDTSQDKDSGVWPGISRHLLWSRSAILLSQVVTLVPCCSVVLIPRSAVYGVSLAVIPEIEEFMGEGEGEIKSTSIGQECPGVSYDVWVVPLKMFLSWLISSLVFGHCDAHCSLLQGDWVLFNWDSWSGL